MKIIIITQDDPFFLKYFFHAFSAELKKTQNIEVSGLVIQAPLGSKSKKGLAKKLYGLYGPVGFFLKGVKYAFVKCMNVIALKLFKGNFPGYYSLEHLAIKNNWEVVENVNINSKNFLTRVEEEQIDLIVSVGGSQKFRTKILYAPKYGCINVHNSKLPKLRGMLPTFWAMLDYENDPTTAVSIFKMDEDWDSGPIILQEEVNLDPKEPMEGLIKRTKILGGQLMVKVLEQYAISGEPELKPNDANQATYKTFPNSEDVKAFKSKGFRLI